MRIVLKDRHQVVHFWANQVQDEGRGSNISFRGGDLFSYSTCIARILSTGTVAWSYRTFSITTSGKHQGPAESAASHRPSVWCYDPTDTPASNMRGERKAVARLLLDAEKAYATKKDGTQSAASKNKQEKLRGEALHIANRANTYLQAMYAAGGVLDGDVWPIDISNLGLVLEELKAAEAAQAVRDAAAREARIKEQARRAEEAKEDLELWKAGGYVQRSLRDLPVALRLHQTPEFHQEPTDLAPGMIIVIQTSHGAEIPVEDAKKLWPLLLRVRRASTDVSMAQGNRAVIHDAEGVTQPHSRQLGVYKLNTIRADGSIVVGCHDIPFSEMESIAKQLGLIEGEQHANV